MVLPSNNTGSVVRDLATRFPHRVGSLMSPGGWRTPFGAYALDNGAFSSFRNGTPFDEDAFFALILDVAGYLGAGGGQPMWIAVPDVVGNREATIEAWSSWHARLVKYGWPLAFVVQDGMMPDDVPVFADVVFVGGSVRWKWQTVPMWAGEFPRVHVGRVNSPMALWQLQKLGVESCDGTGWLRGDQVQLEGLRAFVEGRPMPQMWLFDEPSEIRGRDQKPVEPPESELRGSAA